MSLFYGSLLYRDHLDLQEILACAENWDLLVHPVKEDLLATSEDEVEKVKKDLKVLVDHLDLLATKVCLVLLEPRVKRVMSDKRAPLVLLVLLENKVLPALRESKVFLVLLDRKARKDLKEKQETQDHLVLLGKTAHMYN